MTMYELKASKMWLKEFEWNFSPFFLQAAVQKTGL